jgi:redox-sensitive bicupin YhaK (pirin superfamily)
VRREKGAEIRVYSGSSAGLQSDTRNHVPVTMVEINLEPHASAELDIAASYSAFAFVIDGSVRIGDTELNTGKVGWLDRSTDVGRSVLRVVAGESGARLVLYAGQPQTSRSCHAYLFSFYKSGCTRDSRGIVVSQCMTFNTFGKPRRLLVVVRF